MHFHHLPPLITVLALPLKKVDSDTGIATICHNSRSLLRIIIRSCANHYWSSADHFHQWDGDDQWRCSTFHFSYTYLPIYLNNYISEYFRLNETIYLSTQCSMKLWIWWVFVKFSSYSAAFSLDFTDSVVSCTRHDFLKGWKCWAQFSQNKDSSMHTL